MKILNFGSCNVDHVYSLDHIVHAGETETSDGLHLFPGGKGLNQSIAVAKAGASVYHAGCIGAGGQILIQALEESGVDTSFIRHVPEQTGHAIIQVSREGENAIFLYPGSNAMITRDYVDSVLAHFGAGDILLLQNEINDLDYMVSQAHRKGMQIVLNPSPYNEALRKIDLHRISCLILNEVEAQAASGCAAAEDALAYFKTHYPQLKIMLTLGSKGCLYQDQAHSLHHPIFQVEVVDTTAAGDTFTGYFVAGLAAGWALQDILKTASCASAIAVSRNGAAPSIPHRAEVLEYLQILQTKRSDYKSDALRARIRQYTADDPRSASIEELARMLGYSSVYTGSLVKKLFGRPFKKLLQEQRLALAARLLLESDLSVGEIIKQTGYENESFFRGIFKEKYGMNPLEYRKRGTTHD